MRKREPVMNSRLAPTMVRDVVPPEVNGVRPGGVLALQFGLTQGFIGLVS